MYGMQHTLSDASMPSVGVKHVTHSNTFTVSWSTSSRWGTEGNNVHPSRLHCC